MQANKYPSICVSIHTRGTWKIPQSDTEYGVEGFHFIFKPVVDTWIRCIISLHFIQQE